MRVFPTTAGRARHGVANRFLPRAQTRYHDALAVRQHSPPHCVLTTNRVVRNIKFIQCVPRILVHLVFNKMMHLIENQEIPFDYHTRINLSENKMLVTGT